MQNASLSLIVSVLFLAGLAPRSRAGTQDGARIALHLTTHASKATSRCDTWDVPCTEFQTNGTVGVSYDAYLVVADADPEVGVAGLSCGISYNQMLGTGVDIFTWSFCGALQFPTNGDNGLPWPDAGAGNRMTWDMSSDCQRSLVAGHESEGAHVVAGSFYLYAYSNDVFSVTANTQLTRAEELAVADCGGNSTYLDAAAAGNLHFSHEGTNRGYNPCTGVEDPPPSPDEPPPPPPNPEPRPEPTDSQAAAFMLHVAEAGNARTVCQDAPLHKTDVVTVGTSEHNGKSVYYVYVLGTPHTHYKSYYDPTLVNDGLLALRFGIYYEDSQGEGDKSGPLKVFSWNSCGASGGTRGDWPAPLSGNTLVMDWCETAEVVPFGYFYVAAYAPSTMSLVGFPATGKVEYSTCAGTQEFTPVDPVQVGWVALHGGSIGLDTDGCNPAVEPCTQSPTPVRSITWGQLKSRYKGEQD